MDKLVWPIRLSKETMGKRYRDITEMWIFPENKCNKKKEKKF